MNRIINIDSFRSLKAHQSVLKEMKKERKKFEKERKEFEKCKDFYFFLHLCFTLR